MGRPVHVEVSIDEVRGNQSRLIKKFIKKCKKAKIIEEVKERSFFVKPSKKRRMQKLKKIRNAQKAERERNKRYGS
jgi:ribosomal protein S21